MTKYREILRLASLGISQQRIADSSGVSKKTVNRVLKRAKELGIFWPLEDNETDAVLAEKLFPAEPRAINSNKRMPDYDYIQEELLRNGVNKKLLWTEYLEECRLSGDEPLMYSQFCYHIQQDEEKRHATMHIGRKPGEQIEVDWAGHSAKITEMRLTAMSDAFIIQKDDPKMKDIPFEDRFGMLVDIEYNNRRNNGLKRLIKNAGFDQSDAAITDINYTSGRKLNRELIKRLATCEYITEHRNLFITGATGSGKTYMACAFGMEACKQRYKTKYVRLPDLLLELELARGEGTYKKALARYASPVLLIIDEWLLLKPSEAEQHDILELLHRRRKRSSTIFCSQYDPSGWYDQLGGDDSPLAEAILDRIKHDAYRINIVPTDPSNYRSMREVYGLDSAMSE